MSFVKIEVTCLVDRALRDVQPLGDRLVERPSATSSSTSGSARVSALSGPSLRGSASSCEMICGSSAVRRAPRGERAREVLDGPRRPALEAGAARPCALSTSAHTANAAPRRAGRLSGSPAARRMAIADPARRLEPLLGGVCATPTSIIASAGLELVDQLHQPPPPSAAAAITSTPLRRSSEAIPSRTSRLSSAITTRMAQLRGGQPPPRPAGSAAPASRPSTAPRRGPQAAQPRAARRTPRRPSRRRRPRGPAAAPRASTRTAGPVARAYLPTLASASRGHEVRRQLDRLRQRVLRRVRRPSVGTVAWPASDSQRRLEPVVRAPPGGCRARARAARRATSRAPALALSTSCSAAAGSALDARAGSAAAASRARRAAAARRRGGCARAAAARSSPARARCRSRAAPATRQARSARARPRRRASISSGSSSSDAS